MSVPARRRITAAEFADLTFEPALGGSPELWDGEVVYRASPRFAHSHGQGRVARALGELDPDDPDAPGWWIAVEPDWALTANRVLKPDLAGWRRDRMPVPPATTIQLRPDWVCEVLSPGHHRYDLEFKATVYRDQGVPWYWILDPEERLLQVLRNDGAAWAIIGTWSDEATGAIPPFDDLELKVSRLFTPQRR